jgi:hypothetical protein
MFNFIQKIIYLVLDLQEKSLKKRLGRNFKSAYTNTTSKKVFGLAASLELTSKTEKNKVKLENDVKTILKKYENNPEKLLEFIERSGTKIYKLPFADKFLKFINYEEGFLSSAKGLKGLYLNIIISILTHEKLNLSCKTEPMFLLRNLPLDSYHMIQQFHKWYAMKLNLPGFDAESQNNFQKFINSNDEDIKLLSVEEILGLKEAIARDVEAINFIVDLAKSTDGSKNALKKMTTGGASI